mmetsp:Transcript_44231/g.116232  ORF Transcript_44231/g.116232 Transcript_44231/m.116232 type:complete len:353 (+) Transcript_44231:62-1120(+)
MGCGSSSPEEPEAATAKPPPKVPIGESEGNLPIVHAQSCPPYPAQAYPAQYPAQFVPGMGWIQPEAVLTPQQMQQQVVTVVTTTVVSPMQPQAFVALEQPVPSAVPDLLTEADLQGIFTLFTKVDTNKSGLIDAGELHAILDQSPLLRRRMCLVTGLPPTHVGTTNDLVQAVMAKADLNQDGGLSAAEMERLVRGWDAAAFEKVANFREGDEQRRLAGAAERAQIACQDGGGFSGLTDAEEAKRIGDAALSYTPEERSVFAESDPTVFPGGSHYVTDETAKIERAAVDAAIRQAEHDEYLYKEQFKGLSADEALHVGESVQLGGVVVEDSEEAKPKKKIPSGLAKRMVQGRT